MLDHFLTQEPEGITLVLMRHAEAAGPEKSVLQPELARAEETGRAIRMKYNRVATSLFPRTAQTALAVLAGSGSCARPIEAEPDLGSPELAAEITAPEGFRDLAGKVGFFAAVRAKHTPKDARRFGVKILNALWDVVWACEPGDKVLVVSHSPMIELALWAMHSFGDIPEDYRRFETLEYVFVSAWKFGENEVHFVPVQKGVAIINPPTT